jgi:hypothetical protein
MNVTTLAKALEDSRINTLLGKMSMRTADHQVFSALHEIEAVQAE